MSERTPSQTQEDYGFIGEQVYYPVRLGLDGIPTQTEEKYRPLAEVEFRMVRDTILLIRALDGSDDDPSGKRYLHDDRKFEGACDAAIYLDKSARPVRALVSEFWEDISIEKLPDASFLNIDKIDYMLEMGYSMREVRERHIPVGEAKIEMIPLRDRMLRTAEIRSLYLSDRTQLTDAETLIEAVRDGKLPLDALDQLWEQETMLDGKHVAIVDEVRSSGATLSIAEQLLQESFPQAKFEPLFWSTPATYAYTVERDGEQIEKLADTEKPLWYDGMTSSGRGGIGGKNPEYSRRSSHIAQRIGKHVLGIPYKIENDERADTSGYALRKDIKLLAKKWRAGKVKLPIQRR